MGSLVAESWPPEDSATMSPPAVSGEQSVTRVSKYILLGCVGTSAGTVGDWGADTGIGLLLVVGEPEPWSPGDTAAVSPPAVCDEYTLSGCLGTSVVATGG